VKEINSTKTREDDRIEGSCRASPHYIIYCQRATGRCFPVLAGGEKGEKQGVALKSTPIQQGEVLSQDRSFNCCFSEVSLTIDAFHKWRLNVNQNTVTRPKLAFMFPDKGFSY